MNRLTACLIVGVLVAVVVYVWFADNKEFFSSNTDTNPSNESKQSPKDSTLEQEEINDEEELNDQEGLNDEEKIKEEIKEEIKDDGNKDVNVMDEGLIKYDGEWITGDIKFKAIENLLNARNKLHDLGLIGVYKHNGVGFGNISKRIALASDNNKVSSFYITGSQTNKINNNDMNESHFSIVNNYDIEHNKLSCIGPIRASSESMTHATIYELSENINCVVHIHNNKLWNICINKLPTTNKNVAYGSPEMAKEVKRIYNENVGNIQNMKVFVMGGHEDGLVAFGNSIQDATDLMINTYEKYCNVCRNDESQNSNSSSSSSSKKMNIKIIENYTPKMIAQNDEQNINNGGTNGEFVQVKSIHSDPLVL